MLQSFVYTAPTRILFGQGALAKTANELKALGCGHPMVVTDQGVSPLGFFDRLKDSMGKAGLRYDVFDGVPQDPDLKDIDALAALLKTKNCASVVAIGGGSVLCAGRGAAVTLPSGVSARELVGIGKVAKGPLPMIAIPTTAGSGSEVSGVIVLSDRDNKAIVTIASPHCFPGLAILDPDTLADLPPRQAAISGIDALAHGLEALMTTTPNPISEALAAHACATLFEELRSASLTREMESKARCLVASAMANMACGNARFSLAHAMALPLCARFGVAHGVAAGLLLPPVLEFNLPVAGKRLLPLMQAMGYEPDADPEWILEELDLLLEDFDFSRHVDELKIDGPALTEMAKQVAKSPLAAFNLRRAEVSDIVEIYKAALSRSEE
jgi:alcohol dehydrogenase class IV